jgi:hypothetical protein
MPPISDLQELTAAAVNKIMPQSIKEPAQQKLRRFYQKFYLLL